MNARSWATPFSITLAACALGACGAEEETKKGTARLVPAGTDLSRLDITVTERKGRFLYRAPKRVRGGLVQIRLRNAGKVPHKAQLWRVGQGHTVKEALRAGRPRPRWLTWAGGAPLTRPKSVGVAVQRLSAGTYYVAGTGGERGKRAVLRVTRGGGPGLRAPSAKLTALDYSFGFKDLESGRTAIEFVNRGKEPHHAYFAPMRDGRTLREALDFMEGRLAGPPPVDRENIRETPVLEGGQRQVTRLNLQPGRYAVLCFVSDRRGGPPHTQKGMVAELKVR